MNSTIDVVTKLVTSFGMLKDKALAICNNFQDLIEERTAKGDSMQTIMTKLIDAEEERIGQELPFFEYFNPDFSVSQPLDEEETITSTNDMEDSMEEMDDDSDDDDSDYVEDDEVDEDEWEEEDDDDDDDDDEDDDWDEEEFEDDEEVDEE